MQRSGWTSYGEEGTTAESSYPYGAFDDVFCWLDCGPAQAKQKQQRRGTVDAIRASKAFFWRSRDEVPTRPTVRSSFVRTMEGFETRKAGFEVRC